MGPQSRGDVLFDPNGWDPSEGDVLSIAQQLDLVNSDGSILPMDDTLIRFAASQMEHAGGIGQETYGRTGAVYGRILADAEKRVTERTQELTENDTAIDPDQARLIAEAEVFSELTERASRALLQRNGVLSREDEAVI